MSSAVPLAQQLIERAGSLALAALGPCGLRRRRPGVDVEVQPAFRGADEALEDDPWVEGVGSFLCSKPPSKWLDHDLSQFEDELHRCARQFFRVESTLFNQGTEPVGSQAMRVSITCQDGSEVDKVVRLNEGELRKVTAMEERIRLLFGEDSRLGLIAATRAIMTQLQEAGD